MILGVHHACLHVADVDEAAERWSRLYGLTRADAGGATLLRCAYEDFCLELRPTADGAGRVEHVGYELRSEVSLDDAAERLRGAGIRVRARSRSRCAAPACACSTRTATRSC